MSVPDVIELFDSGSGSLSLSDDGSYSRNVSLRWLISGIPSYAAAEAKGEEIAPRKLESHMRKGLDISPLGNGFWILAADYHNPAVNGSDPEGDSGDEPKPASFSFDTTGGTQHITQAYSGTDKNTQGGVSGQQGHARAGVEVPDIKGAINVQGDQVQGVDVPAPAFSFTETWHFPTQFVLSSYIGTLYRATGKINHTPWRIFDFAEVMCMGARGEIVQGQSSVPINFSFTARPNRLGFDVGDIVGVNKNGWDHMSVQYETSEDNNSIIKRPKFVFIECIAPSFDFDSLRIGNGFPELGQPAGVFGGP